MTVSMETLSKYHTVSTVSLGGAGAAHAAASSVALAASAVSTLAARESKRLRPVMVLTLSLETESVAVPRDNGCVAQRFRNCGNRPRRRSGRAWLHSEIQSGVADR